MLRSWVGWNLLSLANKEISKFDPKVEVTTIGTLAKSGGLG